jgi:hypothetical protein
MFFLVEKLSQLFTGKKKKKKLKNHNNTPKNKEYPLQLEKKKHHNKKKNNIYSPKNKPPHDFLISQKQPLHGLILFHNRCIIKRVQVNLIFKKMKSIKTVCSSMITLTMLAL